MLVTAVVNERVVVSPTGRSRAAEPLVDHEVLSIRKKYAAKCIVPRNAIVSLDHESLLKQARRMAATRVFRFFFFSFREHRSFRIYQCGLFCQRGEICIEVPV